MCFAAYPRTEMRPPGTTPDIHGSACQENLIQNVEKTDTYVYIPPSPVPNFIAKLNACGKKGFRLEMTTKFHLTDEPEYFANVHPAAILRLDEGNSYQYDWFEAMTPGEIVTRINYRAKNGFYFRDVVAYSIFENEGPDISEDKDLNQLDKLISILAYGHPPVNGNIFLLEKKNDLVPRIEHRVISGNAAPKKKPRAELEEQIEEKLKQGFRPVSIFLSGSNRWTTEIPSILLEKIENPGAESDAVAEGEFPQYKVIGAPLSGSFDKKINIAAKEGYRILETAWNIALMIKNEKNAPALFYKRVKPKKESIVQKVSDLSNKDTIYRETGKIDTIERMLFFEGRLADAGERREFRIVRLSEGDLEEKPERSNKERMRKGLEELKQLVREGFVIRDLFFSDGINAILQRKK